MRAAHLLLLTRACLQNFSFVYLFETNVISQQRLSEHVYNPAVYIIYIEAEVILY